MATPPQAPFATCEGDAEAVAKLKRGGLDPTNTAGFQQTTEAVLRWSRGTGAAATMQNSVVPYIYGRCAFSDMADALATATDAGHRIYVLGWWVDPDTRLKDGTPPLLLRDLLSKTKAAVRGMFWDDTQTAVPAGSPRKSSGSKAADNVPIAWFINGLPNGAAILDHKLPFLRLAGSQTGVRGGVHHQKLLVVSGAAGLLAFSGGMDINNTRVTLSSGGLEPLHDVHFRVMGPAANELLKVFRDRWLDHPDSAGLDSAKFRMDSATCSGEFDAIIRVQAKTTRFPTVTHAPARRVESDHAVAIGRTYANLRKFNKNESYSFASSGDETAWKLIEAGIRNSRRYIYIEDQYLVSRRLRDALLTRLAAADFQFLLILMQASSAFEHSTTLRENEFPYLIAARNEIREDFSKVDPKRQKWRMFALTPSADPARQQWCGSYVHSKTFVFDDECAIIGTANADDRGYTFDTEIVASITDDPIGRAAGLHFARDLRVNLWHKHLGVPHAQLESWPAGLKSWLIPPSSAMVIDASGLEDSPLLGPKPILRKFKQADQLWREDIDPDADLLP